MKFDHSFDYYAMRYLLLWHQSESVMVDGFASNPVATLRSAMHGFRVARSFAGLADEQRAKFVVEAVLSMRSNVAAKNVLGLAEKFEKEFERRNLSAASKLLWIRDRSPYLIYDSRALRALKRYPVRVKNADYESYEVAWRSSYDEHKVEINKSVESLVNLQPYVQHWHPTKDSLRRLVRKPWFKERVFDIALWENGTR
ncbi:hypothetical protein [Pseudoxanthomonas mexicana]|uniref:hypothetical protein n=1 Tax=Pseudoxanthomonas mexicana TaxID=128785 RepID=UPI002899B3C6|nr:hypothetical protein [Pseudoxanthomonas mexicana]